MTQQEFDATIAQGFAPENDPNLPQVAYTPPKPKPRIPWLWIGLGLGVLSLVFLGMGKRR